MPALLMQAGRVLFLGNPAWKDDDANRMGATMFLPTLFVTHAMLVAVVMLLAFVVVVHCFAGKPRAQRGFEIIERANTGKSGRLRLQELVSTYKHDDQVPLKASV